MKRTQELRYQAYLGMLLGFLLFFTMLAIQGCTIYRLKAPQSDGTIVEVFVMYPPGKKVNLTDLEIGEFKLGAAKGEQPGPDAYTKSMLQMLSLLYGRPPPVIITPLEDRE